MYRFLYKWKASLADQWVNGVFQSESFETTAMANASALGTVRAIDTLIELDYEKLTEVLNDE